MNMYKPLSGGERILKDSGGTPREQSSPPTQLREIAEKAAYSIYQASSALNFNWNFDCKTTVASIILRAMQESFLLGTDDGIKQATNELNSVIAQLRQQLTEQFKYGYKKGLSDGDDSHALQ